MFEHTHIEVIDGKRCIVANRRYIHRGNSDPGGRRVKVFTARMNRIFRERKN